MKKRISKTAIVACSTSFLLLGNPIIYTPYSICSSWAMETKKVKKTKGKISNISQKAKTIALTAKDQGLIFLKFTDKTKYKHISSAKELKSGEAIIVEYQIVNGENIVTSLEKALVKLPSGTSRIRTEKLAAMLKNMPGDVVLIDARPKVRYAKGHIADSISIPYAVLKKEGDNGAKILEPYKEKQLIFYCGGST